MIQQPIEMQIVEIESYFIYPEAQIKTIQGNYLLQFDTDRYTAHPFTIWLDQNWNLERVEFIQEYIDPYFDGETNALQNIEAYFNQNKDRLILEMIFGKNSQIL